MAFNAVVKEIVGGADDIQTQMKNIIAGLNPAAKAGTPISIQVAGMGPRYTIFLIYESA